MPRYREFRLRNRRTEAGLAEVRAEMEADAALRDRHRNPRGAKAAAREKDSMPFDEEWATLQWEIMQALEDFPEARQAVVAALERGIKKE